LLSRLYNGVDTSAAEAQPVAAVRRGTAAGDFSEFVAPHWPVMELLARRLAPDGQWDEVLQEALITAWRKRNQFDPERGTPRTWLLAVVADKAYKGWRRWRPPHSQLPERGDVRDHSARLDVQAAVASLARRQRTAVVLHYYLGISAAETAQVMGCSVGTVKSTLSDARRQLKKALGEDYRHV
jgi:RNA polymerase sigma-70 factor (ECF subfamily)